jgi:hypothetical protein
LGDWKKFQSPFCVRIVLEPYHFFGVGMKHSHA